MLEMENKKKKKLENVDIFPISNRFILLRNIHPFGKVTNEASLTGIQHLCSVMEVDTAAPSLVTR